MLTAATAALVLGTAGNQVNAQNNEVPVKIEQQKEQKEPILKKTKNPELTEEQVIKYNKKLDALKNAYKNGGNKAVEALHKAFGHTKLKAITKVAPAALSESNTALSISVWRDSSYNYFWEVAWDLGSGSFEAGSENVRDVVGIAISDAESPYSSLDGWSIADDSLQRIVIMDEDGQSHDANANWEGYDKFGVYWSYEDEEVGTWDSVGEEGYAIAQLTQRQDSYSNFNINAEYTHNWSDEYVRLTGIGWGTDGSSVSMSVSWEYTVNDGSWDDTTHNTYSRYYAM